MSRTSAGDEDGRPGVKCHRGYFVVAISNSREVFAPLFKARVSREN